MSAVLLALPVFCIILHFGVKGIILVKLQNDYADRSVASKEMIKSTANSLSSEYHHISSDISLIQENEV